MVSVSRPESSPICLMVTLMDLLGVVSRPAVATVTRTVSALFAVT